jgi:hypothetical protein
MQQSGPLAFVSFFDDGSRLKSARRSGHPVRGHGSHLHDRQFGDAKLFDDHLIVKEDLQLQLSVRGGSEFLILEASQKLRQFGADMANLEERVLVEFFGFGIHFGQVPPLARKASGIKPISRQVDRTHAFLPAAATGAGRCRPVRRFFFREGRISQLNTRVFVDYETQAGQDNFFVQSVHGGRPHRLLKPAQTQSLRGLGSSGNRTAYTLEARRLGIGFLSPDVNASRLGFYPEHRDGGAFLRVPLWKVKDLTDLTVNRIARKVQRRLFGSLSDFYRRVAPIKAETQNLIRAGAFDCLGEPRTTQFWHLQQLADWPHDGDQGMLFGSVDRSLRVPEAVLTEPTHLNRMKDEQELLGFTGSGQPLDLFPSIDWDKYCPVAELRRHFGQRVRVCGFSFAAESPTKKTASR